MAGVNAVDARLEGVAHVGTGAKTAAGTGRDDGTHGVVGVGARDGVGLLLAHLWRPRVELVGPVKRDQCHLVAYFVGDLLVVHRFFSPRRADLPGVLPAGAPRSVADSTP